MPPVVHTLQRAKRRAVDVANDQLAARRSRGEQRRLLKEERDALAELGELALGDGPASEEFARASERVRDVQSRLALERGFDERRPWVTRFEIGDRPYGGSFDAAADPRIVQFRSSFPDARTILELGSLEGGHTFALAALPGVERVLGLEGRAANVARSVFVQDVLGVAATEFVEADLEQADLSQHGRFDAVFCVGLLYHLPRPWELLRRIGEVSDNLFVWTQIADLPHPDESAGGYPGRSYGEYGLADPLSGLSPVSFWPTWDGLVSMLSDAGFAHVNAIEWGKTKRRGPAVTLVASKNVLAKA